MSGIHLRAVGWFPLQTLDDVARKASSVAVVDTVRTEQAEVEGKGIHVVLIQVQVDDGGDLRSRLPFPRPGFLWSRMDKDATLISKSYALASKQEEIFAGLPSTPGSDSASVGGKIRVSRSVRRDWSW